MEPDDTPELVPNRAEIRKAMKDGKDVAKRAKRDFPRGWTECQAYMESGTARQARDGTRYMKTPNGNLMHWDTFLKKYAGPVGG